MMSPGLSWQRHTDIADSGGFDRRARLQEGRSIHYSAIGTGGVRCSDKRQLRPAILPKTSDQGQRRNLNRWKPNL